jgi:phage protein D
LPSNPSDQQGSGERLLTPCFKVMLNNAIELTGIIDFEVTNASHFAADTFSLNADLDLLPVNYGLTYWGQSFGDELEIFVGFDGNPSFSLIYAQIDDVEIDVAERSMRLGGRDLSARFLDVKTAQLFQQQTASQIATMLAQSHGMTASVTPTTQKVGAYYEYYHSRVTKDESEWDLLMFLAEQETYDLWVSGKTLNFQPPVADTAPPYIVQWDENTRAGNFESLKMARSQTLAKDVIVKVNSWNQAQETVIVAENHRVQANKSQRVGGNAQIYTFYPPNLTKDQADKFAAAKAEDITKHERVITGKLPGDMVLNHRSLIKLTGTQSNWDQLYNVDTVTRHMSVGGGFSMEFRAKNHSTQSTIII